ncbi:MAG: HAMP domain-containing sensor histidine kinase, partial [Nannocystaceae bacterium]
MANRHDDRPPREPSQSSAPLRVVDEQDLATMTDEQDADYNLRILQPAFGYIRDHFGEDILRGLVYDCGLPPAVLQRKSAWISHARFEHLLAAIREMVPSDEEFMRACSYQFKKQYGPLLLVMRCMSVRGLAELAARTSHMACRVGRYENLEGTRTSLQVRYHTTRPESRLVCLSRQAAMKTSPTLFMGIAPARLEEHACVARGDEFCEYRLSWHEPLRLRWALTSLALGVVVAALLPPSVAHPTLAFTVLPLLGLLIGVAMEMRRLLAEHVVFSSQTANEAEKVVRAHAEAMDELTELQHSEREWNRRLEEGVALRTKKLNDVVHRLQVALRRRSGVFPAIESTGSAPTTSDLEPGDGQSGRVRDMETAVDKVSRLVGDLVDIARDDPTERSKAPESIDVDDLVGRIRRQLKATMIGRDVRITVFQTREAPTSIVSEREIVERVIESLLFNATRHTDRGSIVVEIGGTPGSLLIKLSDTGHGVSKERLEQVFGNSVSAQGAVEHSSSLSAVARMLDRLGARLDIMSEPNVGTTLWVYIPTSRPASSSEA